MQSTLEQLFVGLQIATDCDIKTDGTDKFVVDATDVNDADGRFYIRNQGASNDVISMNGGTTGGDTSWNNHNYHCT